MDSCSDGSVEFRLLGGVEVLAGGHELPLGSGLQRVLLASLLLRPNRVVSRDELVDQLWGDSAPASAAASLHSLVSRLRRLLADAGIVLETREPGYLLRADPDRVDAHRFERLVGEAREHLGQGEAEQAATLLRRALDLWRGRALLDVADTGPAREAAERLEEARLCAVEDLADAELACGHLHRAVTLLEPHVSAQPFRERACGQLMLALYRLGRQADALAAYRRLRTTVVDELGVEPTPALRRLEERILHHSQELDTPEPKAGIEEPAAEAVGGGHNLPAALTAFIGRAAELEELSGLLAGNRLLTLVGVGGGGKTRLAVELCASQLDRFPDGVWVVDLSPVQEPGVVADAVSAAVGVPSAALLGATGSAQDRLCAHLRDHRSLILLDNCEHLVEAAATVAHGVLTRCPQVSIVATSRELLGIPGEVVWNVPALSLPEPGRTGLEDLAGSDAAALFRDRGRSAKRGFEVSEANAAAVARICRRLDGIPLALELAAARLRILSAQQIADRLDDRFGLLTDGGRTAVPRHQTLRAAIDWSYQALAPREQAMLRRLAVFPAGFDLPAAESVAGDALGPTPGFEALDVLSRLFDKSLIVADQAVDTDRYRLLETVREYAAARLEEAGETEDARRRHRDHFVQVASGEPGDWWSEDFWRLMRRSAADEENLTAAITWSLEHGEQDAAVRIAARLWVYWFYGGRADGVAWLERALAGDPPRIPECVQAMIGLGALLPYSENGDPDRSERLLRDALDLAVRLGDVRARVRAGSMLAHLALTRGDIEVARRLNLEALEASTDDDLAVKGIIEYGLGNAAIAAGDVEEAALHLERALGIAGPEFGSIVTPHVKAALAPVAALRGQGARSEALGREAIEGAARLRLPAINALALTRATEAAILRDDVPGARSTLLPLLELLRAAGGVHYVADAVELAALIAERSGDPVSSARLLTVCGALRSTHGEPLGGSRAISRAVCACADRVGGHIDGRVRVNAAQDLIALALAALEGP